MHRTVTISLPEDVYEQLRDMAGGADVSRVIEEFVRPRRISTDELARSYREMAADEERKREAQQWLEADLGEEIE